MTPVLAILIGLGLVLCGFLLGAIAGIKGSVKAIQRPWDYPKVVNAMLYQGAPPHIFEPRKGMQP